MAWSIDGYWERGEKVHEAVENALYKLGETAVPGLIQALRWPESAIRRGAASALGRIGSAAAVPELIRLLKDEETGLYSSRICDVAAEALRKIGTPEALAAVRQWRREQKS
jgi:HEAT repeat protein